MEHEFFVPLPGDASLRVHYRKEAGQIVRFTVQLEAYLDHEWVPITRYDNAHQFVHRDDLKPDGTQIKTSPMAFASNEEAFTYALRDLRVNHQFYIDRYRKWQTN